MTDSTTIEKVRAADLEIQRGSPATAIALCSEVLQSNPDCAEAHFVISVALTAVQDVPLAITHLEKLIALRPDLAEVHFNLGTLLARQFQHEPAEKALRTALTLRPGFLDAAVNLARLWTKTGRSPEAANVLLQAVRMKPDDAELFLELSQTLAHAGRFSDAKDAASQAVLRNPDSAEFRIHYAIALDAAGEAQSAATELQHVLARNPTNEEAAFLLSAIRKDGETARAPAKYVSRLFDDYAPRYEQHLREGLEYRGPELLFELVTGSEPQRTWNILDLGCGSGLCGRTFRNIAGSITGVDLSSEMVRLSRETGCYDKLEQDDVLGFLAATQDTFDLILAADVFSYLGDLTEVVRLSASRLTADGALAFTAEAIESASEPSAAESDFALLSTRRFAHRRTYLELVAARCGLTPVSIVERPLRRNPVQPVSGWICLFRKPKSAAGKPREL